MSTVNTSNQIEELTDAKEDNIDELQNYANQHDIILLAFIATYHSKRYTPTTSAYARFNIGDEFGIEQVLSEIEGKLSNFRDKKLFLLVNSMGGSLSSAYKISRALRDNFKDITVFVPHYALSGGTLLALIGDRIRMGIMSQLSPLDIQLHYKDVQVSINSLFTAQRKLNEIFRTQNPEELPYTYTHLAESLDPIILEEWTGIKQAGQHYLHEILERTKYSDTSHLVRLLTTGFPTHSFVIQYDDAKDIGLNVERHSDDLEAWNKMRSWLANYINEPTDRHFIRYFVPKNQNTNKQK